MLKSVVLYKVLLAVGLIFTLPLGRTQPVPVNAKLMLEDTAVFRLEGQVFFVSDLKNYLSRLKQFRCFQKESLLLDAIKLSTKTLKRMPQIRYKRKDLGGEKDFLNKIVKLKKLQKFISEQRVNLRPTNLNQRRIDSCINRKYREWDNDLKELLQAELYFQDRFKRNDQKKVSSNLKDSILVFIDTVDKKVPHELLL